MTMPALTINLLTKRREQYQQQVGVNTKVKLISGVILAVYLVILIGVFGIHTFYQTEANNVDKALQQVKLALSLKAQTQIDLATISMKSKSIAEIIQKRMAITALWKAMHDILPAGVQLKSFSIKDTTLQVSISANHFVNASKILDALEQNNLGFKVIKSTVETSRSEDASYLLAVDIKLPSNLETK